MNDLATTERTIAETFERIWREQMQGIPLLNPMLRVETLGFQEWQGRVIGIVITPWLMNLVMLPNEEDDWEGMELGDKQPHTFPSRSYKFMVNEIDGIGTCQTHSLYSPMHEFVNQDHAIAAAQSFLDTLMVERELTEEERVDEELLGRIMRGEETPEVKVAEIDPTEAPEPAPCNSALAHSEEGMKQALSRRELLRGAFLREA